MVAIKVSSAKQQFTMNSICVPRKAGEAAGAITRLVHDDGREMTINVEYNQVRESCE